MKLIDAHVHIFEQLCGFGQRGEARPIGEGRVRWATGKETQLIPPEFGGYAFSVETLIALMDQYGVEKSVVLQGSGYGFQNDYIAESVKKYPDRLKGAGTLDPFCLQAERILAHLTEDLQLRVLKFELSRDNGLCGYHKDFAIDGKEMEIIWETASRLNMTVVLDIGGLDNSKEHIRSIKNIVLRHKNARIVIAHLLAPSINQTGLFEETISGLKSERIWFDIAALPWFTDPDPYPFAAATEYISAAKRIAGADRIIWGSDVPVVLTRDSYPSLLNYLTRSELFCEKELERIMYFNAREAYLF